MKTTDKVNVKMLVEKNACEEGVRWFINKFIGGTTFDKLLQEIEKDHLCESNWDGWVKREFAIKTEEDELRELGYVESEAKSNLDVADALPAVIARWCRRKRFLKNKLDVAGYSALIQAMMKYIVRPKNDEMCIDKMGFYKTNCVTCLYKGLLWVCPFNKLYDIVCTQNATNFLWLLNKIIGEFTEYYKKNYEKDYKKRLAELPKDSCCVGCKYFNMDILICTHTDNLMIRGNCGKCDRREGVEGKAKAIEFLKDNLLVSKNKLEYVPMRQYVDGKAACFRAGCLPENKDIVFCNRSYVCARNNKKVELFKNGDSTAEKITLCSGVEDL